MPSVWCAGEGQARNPSVVAQAPDGRIALWKAAVAGPASVLWDKVRDVVCGDRKRWYHRDWARGLSDVGGVPLTDQHDRPPS